ncbi:hypothetical protein BJ970_002951 [Saccharopolyspora phatthalungensis]|uniref:Uncharacterized protein n=1 Tax=Saccharopolyspora phatthalungensis TaxID=664693 RepID=A0A840Q634_9PSEU|nr:hypothetical protein [Saccharopolyspora phatthalungensis]
MWPRRTVQPNGAAESYGAPLGGGPGGSSPPEEGLGRTLAPGSGPGGTGRRSDGSALGSGGNGPAQAEGRHGRKRPALQERRNATPVHSDGGTAKRPAGHGPGRDGPPDDGGLRSQGPGGLVGPGNPKSGPGRGGFRRENPDGGPQKGLGAKRGRKGNRGSQRLCPGPRRPGQRSSGDIGLRPHRQNGPPPRSPLGSRPTSSSRCPTKPPLTPNPTPKINPQQPHPTRREAPTNHNNPTHHGAKRRQTTTTPPRHGAQRRPPTSSSTQTRRAAPTTQQFLRPGTARSADLKQAQKKPHSQTRKWGFCW